jgi:large subunit ribosomal protein L9
MKVILLQDVAKIGRRGDITDVPDGYALNQLIPKKMVAPATAANTKKQEALKAQQAASAEATQAAFAAAKASLAAHTPVVLADANEKGHLFKAVNVSDIVEAAKKVGIELAPDMLKIEHSIKEVGEHTVKLAHGGETASFTIEVTKT